MHQRGVEATLTDIMHIILTTVTVLFILLQIGFGATAFGTRFRLYSTGTLLVVVVFGALTDYLRRFADLEPPRRFRVFSTSSGVCPT